MLTRFTLFLVSFLALTDGLQAQTYYMSNSVIVNCTGNFYDDGGPTANYSSNMPGPITFTTDDANKHMTVHFDSITLSLYDELRVYNGTTVTAANLLYTIKGKDGKKKDIAFSSKTKGGSLTFNYVNSYYGTAEGWVGSISCCPAASAGTLITSNNTVCAGDTATMTIAGSYCGEVIWQSSANGSTWTDVSSKKGPIAAFTPTTDTYYRAKFASNTDTAYSTSKFVDVNCFRMGSASTVTSCGLDFYDIGGASGNTSGYMGSGYSGQTVTFYPEVAGQMVKLKFNTLTLDTIYENLTIYNGINTSATQLGTMTGNVSNRNFTSSHASGALTVYFSGSYSGSSAGWDADLTCCSAVDNSTVTLVSSATTICGGIDFTLSLVGEYCGQATYESSTDGGTTWAAVSGKIGPFIRTNTTRDRQYRAKFDFGGNLLYSNVVSVNMNCFWMGNSTTITDCNVDFYDDGGPAGTIGSGYNGNGYGSSSVTFYPNTVNGKVTIDFNTFATDTMYEVVTIYNGNSTSATVLGNISGNISNRSFTSSATDGSLTVYYNQYGSGKAGWDADVHCCTAVDNSNVTLTSSVTQICAGIDFTLLLTGTYCGQATYESSTDGGTTWAAVSGKIGPFITTNTTRDRQYRAKFDFSGNVLYSNVVSVNMNCFWMGNATTVTECNLDFYDDGGPTGTIGSGYNGNGYGSSSVTFYPNTVNGKVTIDFNTFATDTMYEVVTIYNGNSTSSTVLGNISGNISNRSFTSSATDGSLTVYYNQYGSGKAGWDADVHCCTAVDNSTATLLSTATTICGGVDFNLSISGTYCGQATYEYSNDGGTTWAALSGKIGPFITTNTTQDRSYRVKFDFGGNVLYSNVVSVDMNCFLMGKSTTITDCNFDFYDDGGPTGNVGSGYNGYGYGSNSVTFYPKVTGEKVKIHFNTLALDTYYESLTIYNGNSTSAANLGSMSGTVSNRTFTSSATDGSLTVYYNQYGSGTAGWDADVTCCNVVNASTATIVTSKNTTCAGQSVDLTVQGTYCGQAQWQSSTDGTTWADIAGKIGPKISTSATQDKYYRVNFVLGATNAVSNNSVFVDVNCALMDSTTVATDCNLNFYDAGGVSGPTGYNGGSIRFNPVNSADKVKITFNTLSLDDYYEALYVYNGTTASGSPLVILTGNLTNQVVTSTHATGALTVSFSAYDGSSTGWDADVTCVGATPPTADGTNATLTSTLASGCINDQYSVSIGGSYVGSIQWQKSLNATTWSNISGANATSYTTNLVESAWYRVLLTSGSTTDVTDSIQVILDCVTMPRIGNDTTVTACELSFYDTGGPTGNYGQNQNKELTVIPSTAGNVLRAQFASMTMNTNDTLFVYDGLSATDPLLGAFTGTAIPPNQEATNAQGALTFVFKSKTAVVAGWVATLKCIPKSVSCSLPIKAYLLGAYNTSSGSMTDNLRTASVLPSSSPFEGLSGFTQVADATSYQIATGVLNIASSASITDWIWLELRDASNNTTILTARPALIRRDGKIVDMDGVSDVTFKIAPSSYYIVVRHRNHLGMMTNTPKIVAASGSTLVDFSSTSLATYGTNALKIVNGTAFMWPGDANSNGKVAAVGGASDVTPVTQTVILSPTNSTNSVLHQRVGYFNADLNLDGKVSMVGSATEITLITQNVILHPSNTNNSVLLQITQQLP